MFTDGSDGTWHHKHQKHHNNHHRHHTRQRRQEWSPSQAIHEKRNEGSQGSSVRSEITFGHETQVAEEWVFLTRNATTVKAHIGSSAILPCEVKKESQFGMVRFFFQVLLLYFSAALIGDSISALIPKSTQACFLES